MNSFSKEPSYKQITSTYSPIYDVSSRILIHSKTGDQVFSDGSCIFIASNLVLTARHVFEHYLKQFGFTKDQDFLSVNFEIWVVRILNNKNLYKVWRVDKFYFSPHTDIAVLHLIPLTAADDYPCPQPCVGLQLTPPVVGSRIVAFGFPHQKIRLNFDPDGTRHIEVDGQAFTSVGEVVEVFHEKRDSAFLKFPCFQVNAKFEGGMSGGPVFDDSGKLCGLVCSGFSGENQAEGSCSYVCLLWPLMGTILDIDRGDSYPRGVNYSFLELAKDGLISSQGWEKISVDFPHVRLLK